MSITCCVLFSCSFFNDMLVHVLFHFVSRGSVCVCVVLVVVILCQYVLLPFCAQASRCLNNGGNTRVKTLNRPSIAPVLKLVLTNFKKYG